MNRIVREHYPVENLPDDLKELLPGAQHVRLVMETEATPKSQDVWSGFIDLAPSRETSSGPRAIFAR